MIAVARTFNIMLNKSGDSGHLCFVPDIRGNAFSLSPLSRMLAVSVSYMAFIMLRYGPSPPTLLRVLSKIDVEFCQHLHLLRCLYDFYTFFLNVVYHVD